MASAQILDGNSIANQIKAELRVRIQALPKPPGLATILVGKDPGSISYVAGKHRDCGEIGIQSIRVELASETSPSQLLARISELNSNNQCTGMIVQLPLPQQIDPLIALSAVDPSKDADGLHPTNLGRLVLNQSKVVPCTPLAIVELANRYGISWQGKNVVIIGRGTTVGRPLGILLSSRQHNATVTLTHTGTKNLKEHTKSADIIVAAAGKPHFLKAEMISPGAVVFDVGITRGADGLIGDVDPEVAHQAAALAPMPGGVGPMTRAMLLSNIVALAEQSN